MGVSHLEELREFLKKNKNKSFSRTALRDELNHYYESILENLVYLFDVEKVIIKIEKEGYTTRYKWKK